MEVIAAMNGSDMFKLGFDAASSQFYNSTTKMYDWYGTKYTSDELVTFYKQLIETYPICSIEDGLAQDDQEGWVHMMAELGASIQIVGDDLFCTNSTRIYDGILKHMANATIIKPNQIGTVTETLQALLLAKEHGMNTIISHRSSETNDSFIADLAVGTSAGQIKAGACAGGERVAKYNRLLRIEDQLALAMLEE
jgi:enolase 1/2/3